MFDFLKKKRQVVDVEIDGDDKFNLSFNLVTVMVLVVAFLGYQSFFYLEGGDFARRQDPTGSYAWVTEQGPHMKWPLLGRLDRFPQYFTINLTGTPTETAYINDKPLSVKFADTYTAKIPMVMRYRLNPDPKTLETLYRATKSIDGVAYNVLQPHARNMLIYTANQFMAEDYMQGGQNDFLSRLYFQGNNGFYITSREKRLVKGEVGYTDLNSTDSKAGTPQTGETFVYVVDIQMDKDGNPRTQANSLAKYGINVDDISLGEPAPDPQLDEFMKFKKDRILKRSRIVEDQRNEREQQITSRLAGERERIEARTVVLKTKDAAVISEEQKVEVAEQQAKMQKVIKEKDLANAIADLNIQEAGYKAAKFEAQKIREKGLAEAEVTAAMYKAKDNKVYMAELEVENNKSLYQALPSFQVTMPSIMNTGGSQGGTLQDNLSNMSSLFLLDRFKLKDSEAK